MRSENSVSSCFAFLRRWFSPPSLYNNLQHYFPTSLYATFEPNFALCLRALITSSELLLRLQSCSYFRSPRLGFLGCVTSQTVSLAESHLDGSGSRSKSITFTRSDDHFFCAPKRSLRSNFVSTLSERTVVQVDIEFPG